eukprot:scaffold207249_cov22-Tisochrysis_lutea.AAC.2
MPALQPSVQRRGGATPKTRKLTHPRDQKSPWRSFLTCYSLQQEPSTPRHKCEEPGEAVQTRDRTCPHRRDALVMQGKNGQLAFLRRVRGARPRASWYYMSRAR